MLLILDRSIPYRVDPESEHRDVASTSPSLAPFVAPGMAGLAAAGRF